MEDIKPSIARGWGTGQLYPILKELQSFGMGSRFLMGEVYFVEANAGDDGYDGLSWDKAKKTLAAAITASNANIAAGSTGWAARNTIFIKGDSVKEDIKIFPSKCDVIGCGSNDAFNKTEIKGAHTETQDGTIMSTGFMNIQFVNDGAAAIFTVANLCGLYFTNCDFIAEADSIHAIHITGTTGHDLRVLNCRLINDEYADKFATAGILVATTTTFWNLVIENSYVEGEIGIQVDATNVYNGLINNNTVKATGITINDVSDDIVVTRNRMISAAAKGTLGNVIVYNAALAADNIVTGNDGTIHCPAETA